MSIKEINRICDLEYYLDRYGAFHTKKALRALANTFGINNFSIDANYHMSVEGNVEISHYFIKQLPIQFKEVRGDFKVAFTHITTMQGYPQIIGGNFESNSNCISSLEGLPQKVGKDCYLVETKTIEDLEFNCDEIVIGEKLTSITRHLPPEMNAYAYHLKDGYYSFTMPYSEHQAIMLKDKLHAHLNMNEVRNKIKRKI